MMSFWTIAPAVAFAVGHVLLMIFILNSSHGFGVNVRWIDRAVIGGLAITGLFGLAMVWQVWGSAWAQWPLLLQAYSLACFFLLFVGLPVVTVLRLTRESPRNARLVRSRTIDLRARISSDELVGHGLRARILRLPFNDSLKLEVSEWNLSVEDLPAALDGLSIVHLTDLHMAKSYGRRFFEEIVAAALEADSCPDLVVITGDFIDDDACIPWLAPCLGRLQGRLGKFAILGNHDYRQDFRGVRRGLRDAGFRTLEGRWANVEFNNQPIAIGGTSAPWGQDIMVRPEPVAGFRILMSHSPDQVYRADRAKVQLMLSGHNHGGQVRLPVFGPILMPSFYSRRFDHGFFRVGGVNLFVARGIGAKDPLRYRCPPEIVRIVVRAGSVSGQSPEKATDEMVAAVES